MALEAIGFAWLGAAIVVMVALSRTLVELGFADVRVWDGVNGIRHLLMFGQLSDRHYVGGNYRTARRKRSCTL